MGRAGRVCEPRVEADALLGWPSGSSKKKCWHMGWLIIIRQISIQVCDLEKLRLCKLQEYFVVETLHDTNKVETAAPMLKCTSLHRCWLHRDGTEKVSFSSKLGCQVCYQSTWFPSFAGSEVKLITVLLFLTPSISRIRDVKQSSCSPYA